MNPEIRSVIAEHSKSFSLASRLLDPAAREDVAVLYAWCRRADDEVDLAPIAERPERVARLYAELEAIYAGEVLGPPVLAEFQALVRRRGIPREYPQALLDGMRSELGAVRVATLEELLLYSYRVAGVVGLMLCHVFGLSDPRAKENAAHLGIAMQLTNICRDVREDAERDRRYLPGDVLSACGDLHGRELVRSAVERILALASRYYRSADAGFYALPLRAALAARAARSVYAAIGDELARRDFDALRGRVRVSGWKKLVLVASAVLKEVTERARRRLFGRALQPEALGGTR
ncbi:MAG TPA: phytoene/squalene synthase family protein [Polyangiaceae bacterium]